MTILSTKCALHSQFNRKQRRISAKAVLLIGIGASLAGCGVNRTVATDIPNEDIRRRHPIALTEQPYSIDIFPTGPAHQLDSHTAAQVAGFAERYKTTGRGPISIIFPSSGSGAARSAGPVEAIRRELARNGAVAPVTVSQYQVENPALASPVRLSFDSLKAKVTHRCGDWPTDLGPGAGTSEWENKTYWNFGCANQATLAAQIADPRDIASPTGETPPDAAMTLRGIDKVRKGTDPATQWIATKTSNIGTIGGN